MPSRTMGEISTDEDAVVGKPCLGFQYRSSSVYTMNERSQELSEQTKSKHTVRNLVIVLFILIVVIILLLLRSCNGPGNVPTVVLPPDYTNLRPDDGAETIPGDSSTQASAPSSGGSVTITFMGDVQYSLSSRTLSIHYQNPKASTHNVVVQVILTSGESEYLLAQSGILEPGYQITSLKATEHAPQLSSGGYAGKLKLLFYDPATGQQAIVDTDIPCTIVVNE